jgi:K+-transporting ATPase ATPase C chain
MKQLVVGVRAVVVLTVLLGLAYPLAVLGVGQAASHGNANGSLVEVDGVVVGSDLIGQSFADADGNPLPQYLQPRPGSYDPTATGGSNQGPGSETLRKDIADRTDALGVASPPPDAVTASFSGLDPHISPAYAALQVPRIAAARSIPEDEVQAVVADHTQGRTLGFLGEPRVDVLEVNVALDRLR